MYGGVKGLFTKASAHSNAENNSAISAEAAMVWCSLSIINEITLG